MILLKEILYKSSYSSNEVGNLLTPPTNAIQSAQKLSIDLTEEDEDDDEEINIQDILNQRNQFELEAAQVHATKPVASDNIIKSPNSIM